MFLAARHHHGLSISERVVLTLQAAEDHFSDGISEMEQGDWNAAAQHFALALHAAKDKARAAEASAYLAAVRLVEAQVDCSDMH